jgi:hypothetical protein
LEPAILSALRQLQLIIVGATLGAIAGSIVPGTSVDLRPGAVAVAAGAILFGLTFALQRFASQPVARLVPAYSSLIGRVTVTLAAALSVVLVFNLLVASDARSVPTRPNAQATVGPVPAAPTQISAPTAPATSAGPVVPVEPAARPPTATQATSSAPQATLVPLSSPAATSPVSPFATPQALPQSPPPSVPTAAPVQTVAPATPQPATAQPETPQPTPVSSQPPIIPTLPPLPTLPIRLP